MKEKARRSVHSEKDPMDVQLRQRDASALKRRMNTPQSVQFFQKGCSLEGWKKVERSVRAAKKLKEVHLIQRDTRHPREKDAPARKRASYLKSLFNSLFDCGP